MKRALSNNNASPPQRSPQSAQASLHISRNDKQVSPGVSPTKSHQWDDSPRDPAFPQDEDKQLLMELIRPKKTLSDENVVQVRKISSHRYKDSDSDSDSAPSSPLMSSHHESSMLTQTDSLRSSMHSSSAVSSDGHMTLVTEMGGMSDMEVASVDIPYSQYHSSPYSSRKMADQGELRMDSYGKKQNSKKSPHKESVDGTPSRTKQPSPSRSKHGHGKDQRKPNTYPAVGAVTTGTKIADEQSKQATEADEYDTEALTKVRFHRMSVKGRSRSPSPRSQARETSHPDHGKQTCLHTDTYILQFTLFSYNHGCKNHGIMAWIKKKFH